MIARNDGGFEELEALIYRLFAEKQFALALLALVMVAQLLSAQFLLLRLKAPSAQATGAPAASQRVDVQCGPSGAQGNLAAARGKVVVVHLGAAADACLAQVSEASPSELVVGVETNASPAPR